MKHKGKDEIRIVDFGSARILKSRTEKLTTFSGAEVIRAPEITKKNKPYHDLEEKKRERERREGKR